MKYWQAKEFSKLVGVSVRTLHHYDEIGLLKPQSREANNGYRLYSEENLLKIQQIMALKSFGFKLSEITKFVENFSTTKELLSSQEKVLVEQISNLQKAHKTLRLIIKEQADKKSVKLENLITLIKDYEMEKNLQNSWEKILTKDQATELKSLERDSMNILGLDEETYSKLWEKLCKTVTQNLKENPEGPVWKDLSIRWMSLVNLFYGSKTELRTSIYKALEEENKNNNVEDESWMSPEIVCWISKAIKFHKLH